MQQATSVMEVDILAVHTKCGYRKSEKQSQDSGYNLTDGISGTEKSELLQQIRHDVKIAVGVSQKIGMKYQYNHETLFVQSKANIKTNYLKYRYMGRAKLFL